MEADAEQQFDFDELSECEGEESTDTGDEGTKRSPSPGEAEAPPDPSVELREKCERSMLSSEPSQAAMLQEAVASILECTVLQATTWDRYGICALKEECFKRKIPLDNLIERRHVLARLYDVLAWPGAQGKLTILRTGCYAAAFMVPLSFHPFRIPFVNRTRVSNVVLLETENPALHSSLQSVGGLRDAMLQEMPAFSAAGRKDAFPGATGPLPVGGPLPLPVQQEVLDK
ncbi:hypothetical protein AK812_SmicGene5705 [Symbiodinium microadriaticum]|uniref:Uncharacterized protein n=1 Tax=Symbiodinium microadriaticum TaxID=2951 RepID=A0A1Q9EST9_SYMMI|nr:hypothetical protein AK812_SmicGene5705 [Symbiodinium microadriaticum]